VDSYGLDCSIEKSNFTDCIWLGVTNPVIKKSDPKLGLFEVKLPDDCEILTRLSRNQVNDLLPYLQHFVDTGDLPDREL
jgi:hypothetical protein